MIAEVQNAQDEEMRVLGELERRRLEEDFGSFVRAAWKVVRPFEPLVEGWYIDAIADYCMSVAEGKTKRLIINQPPRTLKTTIISSFFPCWVWTTKPWWRFIFYSYSFDLAVKSSVERRRIIGSGWYQERWGNQFSINTDENQKHMFSNDKSGRMEVVSQATGSGGQCVIVDDPHSVMQAHSDTEREAGVTMVRQGLLTRLDNQETGSVIVVMQRLHEKDVTGSLLESKNWTHLCLAAEAEEDARIPLLHAGRVMVRLKGDLLDPVRLSPEILKNLKTELGARAYAGQYQQTPSPAGGEIFVSTWWKWWDPMKVDWRGLVDEVVIAVDPSVKDKESGSDAAVQAWGIKGITSYLLERDTEKRNFASTIAAIRGLCKKYETLSVLCEDKSNGPAIISELKTEFHMIAYNPDWGDKTARAHACSPMVEAGNVYLPQNGDGVYMQKVCTLFPNVEMKDDVDAMTNFLNWRRNRGTSMAWLKKAAEAAEAESKPQEVLPATMESAKALHDAAKEEVGMVKSTEKRTLELQPVAAECKFCHSTHIFATSKGVWCRACNKRYEK